MNKYQKIPDYILDLHGKTCNEAKDILLSLFSENKYHHIRIITGKGTFREKGGVLRDFVKSILEEKNISFSQSKIEDGGEGAIEVYL